MAPPVNALVRTAELGFKSEIASRQRDPKCRYLKVTCLSLHHRKQWLETAV